MRDDTLKCGYLGNSLYMGSEEVNKLLELLAQESLGWSRADLGEQLSEHVLDKSFRNGALVLCIKKKTNLKNVFNAL